MSDFLTKYGARAAARWGAIACNEHDRVVDLCPIPIWWPYMADLGKLLRHFGRCPCHRHDAARCRTECARYGQGCPRGPLTQLEVGRLMDAVGQHQETITESGSRAAILELTKTLTVGGVPLEQLVDVTYLLAANGHEDES